MPPPGARDFRKSAIQLQRLDYPSIFMKTGPWAQYSRKFRRKRKVQSGNCDGKKAEITYCAP
jgi:hypothetical protein